MAAPLYQIPGQQAPSPAPSDRRGADGSANARPDDASNTGADGTPNALTVSDVLAESRAYAVIDELERDLIGLAPVKGRIRETRIGRCSAFRCSISRMPPAS